MPYLGKMNNSMKVDTVSGFTMTTNSTLKLTLDPSITPYTTLPDQLTDPLSAITITTYTTVNETNFLNTMYPVNGSQPYQYSYSGITNQLNFEFIFVTLGVTFLFLLVSVGLFLYNRRET